MKEVTGIKSKYRPIEIDDTSSNTTVYVRHNIYKTVDIDPVFGTEEESYIYDETQYSLAEWYKVNMEKANDRIFKLEEIIKSIANELEFPITL